MKGKGTIIGKTKLTETSLIITWCTDRVGVIKTVARGARRPKSQFAGKLDLFYHCEIEVLPAKRGDLHTLKELAVLDHRGGLQSSYWQTLCASYFAKLIIKVAEPETSVPELDDLLNRALTYLTKETANWKAIVHFEKQLVEILGIGHPDQAAIETLRAQVSQVPRIREELRCKYE